MGDAGELLRLEGVYRKGYGLVPKFVMHDRELSLESKAIYAYLCALAGSGDVTFPYRETILRQLKMAKNTYYHHYKPLIDHGYITVERPEDKKAANIYTLVSNPKKAAESAPKGTGEGGRLGYRGLKAHGYGSIPRTVMQEARLSVKAKGLYAYFCSYCGAGDCAFPRKDHILYHLGISEPTYYKALNQLKELDYLRVEQRKDAGRFAVNDYWLNEFPGMAEPLPRNCDTETPDTKNCDIACSPPLKICDTGIGYISNGDAKKQDAFLIPNTTTNKPNPTNPSTGMETADPVWEMAVSCVETLLDKPSARRSKSESRAAKVLAALDRPALEDTLAAFLAEFRRNTQGRAVRSLPAYLAASLWAWIAEQPARQALRGKGAGGAASYDLTELERMIDRPQF